MPLLQCAGGEAHPQEQLDGDLHGPAGAGQAQRACDWGEGGSQAGLLPLLEYQALLHQVSPTPPAYTFVTKLALLHQIGHVSPTPPD